MTSDTATSLQLFRRLLPQFSIIAIIFTVTGVGLATVPLFIKTDLGLGATAIGVTSGAQFISAIVLRIAAGRYCDRRGSARAVRVGLVWSGLGGLMCLLAWALRDHPLAALSVLLAGRVVVGGGESYVMSGVQTWCLALAGTPRAAQVIGWVGTAMFTALALGAPLGGYLYQMAGFSSVGVVTSLTAVAMLLATQGMVSPDIRPKTQPPLRSVMWRLRVETGAMALAGFTYGAMVSFSVVLFIERAWTPSWAALTAFSFALVASRIFFGSLPDRIGGTRAAWLSLIVLAAGMVGMAVPGGAWIGLVGALVSGLGYAVVYPALTREAVQRVEPESRGTALALVSASIYVTLGLGNPLLGMMADRVGTGSVFFFSGAMSLVAALVLVIPRRDGH
jgi:MFS family permease